MVLPGEEYILFLWADTRKKPPNTSASPRYSAAGVWSGKANVVNGKIQFLPRASAGLHKYDNTDVDEFIALLRDKINALLPKK